MIVHVQGAKGRKDRDVMLSPRLLQELREHWHRLPRKPRVWLFPSNRCHTGDHPIDPKTPRDACRAAAKRAGLRHVAHPPLPASGDPRGYLSSEFAAIGVDELSKNEMSTFEFLRLRCRWPGVEHPKFVAATNPGGIGHVWVKDLWVDRDFSKYPHLAPIKDQFAFVQARAADNPHLPASYWEKLNTLPDHMWKAYADGDWESFAGQFFNVWNQRAQVISRHDVQLEPYYVRWISGDLGFQHPACYHFHAQVGNQTITYAELWGRGMGIQETARLLSQMAGGSFCAFYLGPDAWAKRDDSNPIAHQLSDALMCAGGKVPYPIQATHDRIGGAHMMYKKLRDGEWLISDACPKLVESIPQLIHDEPPHQEDVKKVDWTESQLGDDPYDSARYGLYSHFQPAQKSKEVEVREKAATITDPIERWSYLRVNLPREEDNAPFRINYKMRWEQEL